MSKEELGERRAQAEERCGQEREDWTSTGVTHV